MPARPFSRRVADRAANLAFRAVLGIALALPHRARLSLFGWVARRIAAPLAGWPRRIRGNLAHAWPDLPAAEVDRLTRLVPDRMGRTILEFYTAPALRARLSEPQGAGADAFAAAMTSGRPVLIALSHFGNYTAFRVWMTDRYGTSAALYRPMRNTGFNLHYLRALGDSGGPLFPQSRAGMRALLRHLEAGNAVAILHDQRADDGPVLPFFGRPARTSLSIPRLAQRTGAQVFPVYATRQRDGESFALEIEPPLSPGPAEEMMRALNASLEARIRAHPDQWMWTHRRWLDGGRPGTD